MPPGPVCLVFASTCGFLKDATFLIKQQQETLDSRFRLALVPISSLPLPGSVILDSFSKLSDPQLPHLQNAHNPPPRDPERRPHTLSPLSEIITPNDMKWLTFDDFQLQKR